MYYVYSTKFHGRYLTLKCPCYLVSTNNRYPACYTVYTHFSKIRLTLFITNFRTFPVPYGGISDEFGAIRVKNKLWLKVKSDHHSKFSNLSNWKEEA